MLRVYLRFNIYFIFESLLHILWGKVTHAFKAVAPLFVLISLHVGQTLMLVILQLYLQKSLAQQVILLFNLFFEFYFYFLFYKKRKLPNIKDPFLRAFIFI